MAIKYQDIRNERQWRASTGLTKDQFLKLAKLFGRSYEELFSESLETRQNNSSSNSTFKTYEELLFFGLYSLKSGLTYDLLSLSFGLSTANAYKNQSVVIAILEETLEQKGLMPKRSFKSEKEFKDYLSNDSTILIDATEQPIQRSVNQEEQEKDYSGKKKPYS